MLQIILKINHGIKLRVKVSLAGDLLVYQKNRRLLLEKKGNKLEIFEKIYII